MEPVLHMESRYQILTFMGGTVGQRFCDCYDITLLRGGATFAGYWETNYELCLDQQSYLLNHIKLPH